MTTLNDAREFGAGIEISPQAKYWRDRSKVWMRRAQELGWKCEGDKAEEDHAAQVAEALKGEVVVRKVSDAEAIAWAERNDFQGSFVDLRAAIEDAQSIGTSAPAVVSAAGTAGLSDETRLFADGFDYGFVCGQENPVGHRKDAYVIQAWKEYKVQP